MDMLKTRLDTVQGDLPQVTPLEQEPWIRGAQGYSVQLEGSCEDLNTPSEVNQVFLFHQQISSLFLLFKHNEIHSMSKGLLFFFYLVGLLHLYLI